MRSWSSLVALAATLLLHLGLATFVFCLPESKNGKAAYEPVTIALLTPAPAPAPTASTDAEVSIAPATEKRSTQRKLRSSVRPKEKPRAMTELPSRAEAATEIKQPAPAPAQRSLSAQPSPHASTPATSGSGNSPPTSVPVRTSATEARYASTNRKPPYPRISQSNEEQGTVVLRVLVKADGTADSVEIKQSSGHPRLDEAARSTVQTWRFSPATVDGRPVAEWYQLAIPFTLQNN